MAFHYLDPYLWWQVVQIWMYVLEALGIVLIERFSRLVFMISSFILPVGWLDWVRHRFIRATPRLLRGFRDNGERAEFFFDTPQLIKQRGYQCEEHYVKTSDGFLLCMHRIPHGRDQSRWASSKAPLNKQQSGGNSSNSNNSNNNSNNSNSNNLNVSSSSSKRTRVGYRQDGDRAVIRPPVFVMHGFLQSSEAWVSGEHSLPFLLADAGYDVWIGNARGNKYSCKHERYTPQESKYWDFCLDEAALIDIPALIQHILQRTQAPSIGYVGFSQGTAVAFASFSMNHELAKKVNMMVAMGPATVLKGFSNPLVDALTRSSPEIVYLILGKKDLLPSTLFWKRLLSSKAYLKTIDKSCRFLFGWDMANIEEKDKLGHYAHIYSYSSVKTVVQWFQFLKTGRFQMYDNFRWRAHDSRNYVQPRYATESISCPIAVFFGGRDQLPDTAGVIDSLPKSTRVYEVRSYEHMDFMYSSGARLSVYPKIIELLTEGALSTGAVTLERSCVGMSLSRSSSASERQQRGLPIEDAVEDRTGLGITVPFRVVGNQGATHLGEEIVTPTISSSPAASPQDACGGNRSSDDEGEHSDDDASRHSAEFFNQDEAKHQIVLRSFTSEDDN